MVRSRIVLNRSAAVLRRDGWPRTPTQSSVGPPFFRPGADRLHAYPCEAHQSEWMSITGSSSWEAWTMSRSPWTCTSSPQSVGGPRAGETGGGSTGSPMWARMLRIGPGSVMKAVRRMSPPQASRRCRSPAPSRVAAEDGSAQTRRDTGAGVFAAAARGPRADSKTRAARGSAGGRSRPRAVSLSRGATPDPAALRTSAVAVTGQTWKTSAILGSPTTAIAAGGGGR